jgi:hypothetical protein
MYYRSVIESETGNKSRSPMPIFLAFGMTEEAKLIKVSFCAICLSFDF